uniref:AarF domain containing kinase 2 n=1 Tax=Naja naja TaxID=35670 RepID=A0A8C6Y9D5_NAJNA
MSVFCYWTARNFFPSGRILTVKKTLCFVRKWRKTRATRFTRVNIQNWSGCQAVAKILFVCWGIEGLSRKTKCEGAAGQIINTNVGGLSQARLSSVAFLRDLGFAFSVIIRGFILLLKFSPLVWFYPFTYFSPSFATLWLHLLLKFTESSGPTFIKLGQWASTRRDLFSEEFCVKFSKLHIKVIPHPWDYTKRSLDKAFGEVWEKIFMFESREPIGSGCVAQVYKAYVDNSTLRDPVLSERAKISVLGSALEVWKISGLKGLFRWFWWRKHKDVLESDGQPLHKYDFYESVIQNSSSGSLSPPLVSKGNHIFPVAIKVLHPGLVQQVQMDLFLMKIGSRFLELFPGIRWLSVTEIVEEFEKLMIQQIDLRYEAKNLQHFHLNFKGTDYVRFPLPLHPFVTKNVLVETFEESKPISHYLHIETKRELRQKIAKMGMDMLLKMVFVDNFVHADLHPGNILVQGAEHFGDHPEEGTVIVDLLDTLIVEFQPSPSPLRLVLLDAGIVAELQTTDLENFRAVFTCIVLGQGEKVAELILHHSRANQCKDVEKFKADMAELVTRARNNAVALGKFQVGSLLSSVFKLLMTHQVKLESNFACVVFAIMVLEGLGRSLDPDLDVLKAAKPLLINPPN